MKIRFSRFCFHLPHAALLHRPADIWKGISQPLEGVYDSPAVLFRVPVYAAVFGLQKHGQPLKRIPVYAMGRLICRVAGNAARQKLLLDARRAVTLAAKQLARQIMRIIFVVDEAELKVRPGIRPLS